MAEIARADRPAMQRRAKKKRIGLKRTHTHTHKEQGPIIRYEVDANNAPMHTMDMMTMMKRNDQWVKIEEKLKRGKRQNTQRNQS